MRCKKGTGPSPRSDKARLIDQLTGKIDKNRSPQTEAEQAIADMLANGATFYPQHRGDGLKSFTFEVAGGGDRERCREILREVKAAPGVWSAMVRIVETTLPAEVPHG